MRALPGWREPQSAFFVWNALAFYRHFAGQYAPAIRAAEKAYVFAVSARFAYGRVLAQDMIGHSAVLAGRIAYGTRALELAAALARNDGTAMSDERALAIYDTERVARANRVVAAARRNGWMFHLTGTAALARNVVMRHMPAERVMAGYDWVYGWRGSETER